MPAKILFLAVLHLSCQGETAKPPAPPERIPVLAWGGPPQGETSAARYRELAEAGFTHNYSGFSSLEKMQEALDVAKAAGIKQFVSIPELEKSPEEVGRALRAHPALAGYYLRDEPSASDFEKLAAWAKRITAVDPDHPCYINLFPNYATPAQLGSATYREHLDVFIAKVPVPILSFDHYPVVGKSLRPEWYENLELVSAAARKSGKPFWAFALAVAHDPYPVATLEHLRLQVFSNLAYGAQGIQYFTYWTSKSDVWNFHEAPISVDGKKTVVYDRVRQVNDEIKNLSAVFKGATVSRPGHTGTLPRGTQAYQPAAPVTKVETSGTGAVISHLVKGAQRAVVLVNRDFLQPMPFTLTFDGTLGLREFRKDGTTADIAGREWKRDLAPGDIAVVVWDAK
ncbi:MAG TPA: beta-galactosidase [Verrucomicrobiales bacterium]|nr:beta-galactosidase [Verrucomicrobiales bacterium]